MRSKWVSRRLGLFVVWVLAFAASTPASANPADLLLLNGKIVTLDAGSSVKQALAIEAGDIAATGSSDEIRKLAGPSTKVIDLGGRTVIPGLIDSHIHAIRAGFRYATEVNWEGATNLNEALERLRSAAARKRPDQWLIVAGGFPCARAGLDKVHLDVVSQFKQWFHPWLPYKVVERDAEP